MKPGDVIDSFDMISQLFIGHLDIASICKYMRMNLSIQSIVKSKNLQKQIRSFHRTATICSYRIIYVCTHTKIYTFLQLMKPNTKIKKQNTNSVAHFPNNDRG